MSYTDDSACPNDCGAHCGGKPHIERELAASMPELQAITLRGLTSNWRPGSHDTADTPDGANRDWTWEDEAYDLLVETRPYYQAGVLARVHNEGIGFADDFSPVQLGNDGRVWDGHHRIVAAMALGISVLLVDVVPPTALTKEKQ